MLGEHAHAAFGEFDVFVELDEVGVVGGRARVAEPNAGAAGLEQILTDVGFGEIGDAVGP